jgi:DedD protein
MERKLQERMIGALVLVLALVIVGPLVLDGGARAPEEAETVPGQRADELRSHTFRVGEPAPRPSPPAAAEPAAAKPVAQLQPPAGELASAPGADDEAAGALTVAEPPPVTATPGPAPPAAVAADDAPAPRPAPPPVPSAARELAPRGGWLVQVGTFGQKDNAERLTASLRQKGFDASLSPTTRSGRTLYRVRVGPAGPREAAIELASRLEASGQSGQVVAQ